MRSLRAATKSVVSAVVYRKGELSKATIDREWPHQVALPGDFVAGRNCTIIDDFARGLSVCRRHQGFYRGSHWFICYCFAERAQAEQFQARFGGELIDPKDRPKWPGATRR